MMKKIEKLTPEQEEELQRFRQQYLELACGGGRADRDLLQAATSDAYAEIGKPSPTLFIFDSPAACVLAIKIFQMRERPEFKLGGQLGDQLWGQLGGQLRGQLGDQLWGQLGGQLRGQRLYNPNYMWGSQDLFWIAWGKFAEKIGVKLRDQQSRRLDIMDRIGRQCEWWWPFENIVIASQRPQAVRWDESRRLHCEDGPAVEYADGYTLFAWHGARLPAKWVLERETIDPVEILKEPNVETRTAGAACIGWPRMLSALDYTVIDSDPNPRHGEVIEIAPDKLGLREPGRFLKAECPRNKPFICEGIPNHINTVKEAQAWRVGLSVEEFEYPTVRT